MERCMETSKSRSKMAGFESDEPRCRMCLDPCGFQRAESLVETTMSGQDHRALRPLANVACFVEVACFALTAHVADAQALAISLVT